MHYTTSPLWINEIPKYPILSVYSVGFSYLSVCQLPTSVSVSVCQNIRYRFGFSVYRPMTTAYIRPSQAPLATQITQCHSSSSSSSRCWLLLFLLLLLPLLILNDEYSFVVYSHAHTSLALVLNLQILCHTSEGTHSTTRDVKCQILSEQKINPVSRVSCACRLLAGTTTSTSCPSRRCSFTRTALRMSVGSCWIRRDPRQTSRYIRPSSLTSLRSVCSFCNRTAVSCTQSAESWRSRWASRSRPPSPTNSATGNRSSKHYK